MTKRSLAKISVVIPVFNEEHGLAPLHRQLSAVLAGLGCEREIIFVDDGSKDGSANEIRKLRAQDPSVKLLSFSRNFGHQIALTAGMDHASGDVTVFMDADLQHPPELIPQMVAKWREGYDVVYSLREETENATWFKNLSAAAFYRTFRKLAEIELEANVADFRLLDKKVVRVFREEIRERTRFLRGLTAWVGFPSIGLPYKAAERTIGVSKYNIKKMFLLAVDGIISFSVTPLYIGILAGFLISIAGFIYALLALYSKVITGAAVPGWTSLIFLVAIIGGIQLMLTGVVGIYVGRIYDESKKRPLYIVNESAGFQVDL